MPCHEEHCQDSLKKYGYRADDIHTWMDQPSKKWQGSHRQFRHDTETVKLAGDIFGKKYGRELAKNIALDHIMADHKEGLNQTNESVLMKCANCGGQLAEKSGKLVCDYCGYQTRASIITDEAYEFTKLPAKTKKCVMYRLPRINDMAVLPKALPPIDLLRRNNVTIDEFYREFSDKEQVWQKLMALGYNSLCVQDLRNVFRMTDSEIKKLLQESRGVTVEELKRILSFNLEP